MMVKKTLCTHIYETNCGQKIGIKSAKKIISKKKIKIGKKTNWVGAKSKIKMAKKKW